MSLTYEIDQLFKSNLGIGESRHAAKLAKRQAGGTGREMGDKIHSYGTLRSERAVAIRFVHAIQASTDEKIRVQQLSQLTREHVYWYLAGRQAEVAAGDLSPNTLSADVTGLRRLAMLLFHHQITPDLILPDDYQVPRAFRPRGAYSPDEARAIIAYVDARNSLAATVLLMQRFGGLRIHEAITLRTFPVSAPAGDELVPGIDFECGAVTIKGKGGRVRTVALLDATVLERIDPALRAPLANGLQKRGLAKSKNMCKRLAANRAFSPVRHTACALRLRTSYIHGCRWQACRSIKCVFR